MHATVVFSVKTGQTMGDVHPKKRLTLDSRFMCTLEGYITAFGIIPASVDDREDMRDFAENCLGLVVLGDKVYTGGTLFEDMPAKGVCLMSLKPSNYKTNWPWWRMMSGITWRAILT